MISNQRKKELLGLTKHLPTPIDLAGWALGAALVVAPVYAVAKAYALPWDPIVVPLQMPVTDVKPREPMKFVDPRELDCLADNIYYESRNQSELGQLAVGLVTLTRVQSERWSDTVCDVVHEPRQFTWTWDGKQNHSQARAHADQLQYLHALNLASRILYGEFDNVRDMFAADHYHTTKVRPQWAKRMERLAVIDDHIFYVDQ